MGTPQQTYTPPPASTTFTWLPQIVPRYTFPASVATLGLLARLSWLTSGAEAPEGQGGMVNLETLQVLRG